MEKNTDRINLKKSAVEFESSLQRLAEEHSDNSENYLCYNKYMNMV